MAGVRKSQVVCSIGSAAREAADAYAERHDVTLTETVRRALVLLDRVDKGELRVFSRDGETRAEVFTL